MFRCISTCAFFLNMSFPASPLIQPLYLRLRRIFFKKGKKSLTIRQERGNIFKQSASTASNLRSWMDGTNRICEGGGTGRRARLRCVWFILGGSSPLPRTIDQYTSCAGFSFAMRENAGPAAAEGPRFLLLQSRRGLHRDQEHGTLCLCTMVYERL